MKQLLTKGLLIGLTMLTLSILILLPLVLMFSEAFAEGTEGFLASFEDPNNIFALQLSLGITLASIILTGLFGLSAAWLLSRFRFPGRNLFLALLDLPFTLSPILVGLLLILLYGKYGILGPFLEAQGLQIIFSWPGVLLSTLFIACPFVVKELLPVMEELGSEAEEAALTLGARGWQIFWRVSFPALRTAFLYGMTLACTRAAGEFGAASVVSGLIRGQTATLPIQIEILYNEYENVSAFSLSLLFGIFALISISLKYILERKLKKERKK